MRTILLLLLLTPSLMAQDARERFEKLLQPKPPIEQPKPVDEVPVPPGDQFVEPSPIDKPKVMFHYETQMKDAEVLTAGVTLYTSDGDWCAPCKKQKKILIDAGGMTVDGKPIWLFKVVRTNNGTVPRWVPDNKPNKTMTGYREATSLKKWIDSYAIKSMSNSGRTTKAELDAWIRDHYTPSTLLDTDVSPRSNVWNHLVDGTNGTHTFTSEQVTGLEQWVALALHNEIHKSNPGISPNKTFTSPSSVVATADMEASPEAVAYVLSEFLIMQGTPYSDPNIPAYGGWFEYDIDLPDSVPTIFQKLMKDRRYQNDKLGLTLLWPGEPTIKLGTTSIKFQPAIKASVRKLGITASASVSEITFTPDYKSVTVITPEVLIPDLTINFK